MTALAFLSPDAAAAEVRLVSPLARVAAGHAFVDVSSLGKLELRGSVDRVEPAAGEQLIVLTPERALLVTPAGAAAAARDRLHGDDVRAYDVTAALAALELTGERLLRRLTQLDLDLLPAAGAILRETPAVIQPLGEERFRLFVPQELAHSVATAIVDLTEGLA